MKIYKWFFNWLYKIRPPKVVNYKNWAGDGGAARARVNFDDNKSYQMEIEGEKYPYPGFPRGHVLTGPLAALKHKVKNLVFNQVFEELEKMHAGMEYDMLPPERMCPAIQELHRVLQELEDAEVVPDMKGRIRLIRRVMTFFLQEDDAYRFRFQWVMERLNIKKVKLTDADKYYFRGKYFKVDHDKFDY